MLSAIALMCCWSAARAAVRLEVRESGEIAPTVEFNCKLIADGQAGEFPCLPARSGAVSTDSSAPIIAAQPATACDAITNGAGAFVIVQTGSCSLAVKYQHALVSGAAGLIVMDTGPLTSSQVLSESVEETGSPSAALPILIVSVDSGRQLLHYLQSLSVTLEVKFDSFWDTFDREHNEGLATERARKAKWWSHVTGEIDSTRQQLKADTGEDEQPRTPMDKLGPLEWNCVNATTTLQLVRYANGKLGCGSSHDRCIALTPCSQMLCTAGPGPGQELCEACTNRYRAHVASNSRSLLLSCQAS